MDYQQQEDGWCGPAALSYVLGIHGIDISQKRLVRELGTTKHSGTDSEDMVTWARRKGYHPLVLSGGSATHHLETLHNHAKEGNYGIVDYTWGNDPEDGHYAVFLRKTGESVVLWNPSTDKLETRDVDGFMKKWEDREESNRNWALILHIPS